MTDGDARLLEIGAIPAEPRRQSKFSPRCLAPLGGLRGICAVTIVAGHYFSDFAPREASQWPFAPVEYLQPVTVFLLLSGLTLAAFYPADKLTTRSKRWSFFAKRIARLVPVYYTALLLGVPAMVQYQKGMMLWSSVLLTPLFVQSVTLLGNGWIGPLWFVSCIMICYALYPCASGYLNRVSKTVLWVTLSCCYLVPLLLLFLMHITGFPMGVPHNWALTRVPQFIIGVYFGQRLVDAPSLLPCPAVIADFCTLLYVGVAVTAWVLGRLLGPGYWWYLMLYAEFVGVPLYCLWIGALCHDEELSARSSDSEAVGTYCRSVTTRLLNLWVFQQLGDLSMCIYMLHYPVCQLWTWIVNWRIVPMQVRNQGMHMGPDNDTYGLYALDNCQFISVLCIVLVLALIVQHYVENPMRSRMTVWLVADGGSGSSTQ